jgi:hypothetical protein
MVCAGSQMREATRQLGGVARVGDAKVHLQATHCSCSCACAAHRFLLAAFAWQSTLGFRLPAKHVIHTAGPLLGAGVHALAYWHRKLVSLFRYFFLRCPGFVAEFRAGGVRAITRTYRK